MLRTHRIQFLQVLSARARQLKAIIVQDQPPHIHGDAGLIAPRTTVPRSITVRDGVRNLHRPEDRLDRDRKLTEIRFLTPDKKTELAEQLFDRIDEICDELAKRYVDCLGGRDDLMRISEWWNGHFEWFLEMDKAFIADLRGEYGAWYRSYRSSAFQPLTAKAGQIGAVMNLDSVSPRIIEGLTQYNTRKILRHDGEVVLHNGEIVPVSYSRGELAYLLCKDLSDASKSKRWRNHSLVHEIPISAFGAPIGDFIPWPLDPQEPVMQSLQRVLGWHFDVQVLDDVVRIGIDFGEGLEVAPK